MGRPPRLAKLAAALAVAAILPACNGTRGCSIPKPPPSGPFCTQAWCTVAGAPMDKSNGLGAVAAISSDDVWVVGVAMSGTGIYPCPEGVPDLGGPEALVEHWDGRAWTVVPTGLPTPGPDRLGPEIRLSAVAAASASDVWAAGSGGGYTGPTFIHWNGKAWNTVPGPTITPKGSVEIRDLAALASGDIWAVGSVQPVTSEQQALLLHWDGRSWKRVPVAFPPYAATGIVGSAFSALVAAGPDDVWAVGYVDTEDPSQSILPSRPLALHFDGHAWTAVASPALPGALGNGSFAGVAAVGTDDVWAVGSRSGQRPGALITLTEHWDGTMWTIVPSPNGGLGGGLAAVGAGGPSDIWAVGSSGEGDPMTLHWNGSRWTLVAVPTFPDVRNGLTDVTVGGPGDVWAVGSHGYVEARSAAYILRLRPGS